MYMINKIKNNRLLRKKKMNSKEIIKENSLKNLMKINLYQKVTNYKLKFNKNKALLKRKIRNKRVI
jgi:hypothetical protein